MNPERDECRAKGRVRAHVIVRGIVQGVGFRPFVHRLAQARGLSGWVLNSSDGVEVEAEGGRADVVDFVEAIPESAPPLASIQSVEVDFLPPAGYRSFSIEDSRVLLAGQTLVSPDIATCPDCLAELFDGNDRRYQYPFTNCTNCGPRFTIIEGLPYDRAATTMRQFDMCPSCQDEYEAFANRRFHAQPNACPRCGPSISMVIEDHPGPNDEPLDRGAGAIEAAVALLERGGVVAIKGLGGFHLACDAANGQAVALLRERKRRVQKPFAIMVRDLAAAASLCNFGEAEALLLGSQRRPIVLLDRRPDAPLAAEVAPGNKRLGVMLPYTPLHHLLAAKAAGSGLRALVMTSGNINEEPIAKDNDDALAKLSPLADGFLLHDRPIHSRCDDSVAEVVRGQEVLLRRSRGYVPTPLTLNLDLPPLLACGAQLKNTFCLAQGRHAFLSQHVGDLENEETLDFFVQSIEQLQRLFNVDPVVIAHDLHPDYLSTRYALSRALLPRVAVQHHHAHVAACMAENGLGGQVIGVAFDGGGYGLDGTIWGGEFIAASYQSFWRVAHLKPLSLPGGALAIRRPQRVAVAALLAAFHGDLPAVGMISGGRSVRYGGCFAPTRPPMPSAELSAVVGMIRRSLNSPLTSSCGRLFDAVSALIGICDEVTYEGQAAVELETAAEGGVEDAYPFEYSTGQPMEIDWSPAVRAVVADLLAGLEEGRISAKFHNGLAQMIAVVCAKLRSGAKINRVCLSGGVFQNRYLLRRALDGLLDSGFEVYIHHRVPCNDGGISLGQALVAGELFRSGQGNHVL